MLPPLFAEANKRGPLRDVSHVSTTRPCPICPADVIQDTVEGELSTQVRGEGPVQGPGQRSRQQEQASEPIEGEKEEEIALQVAQEAQKAQEEGCPIEVKGQKEVEVARPKEEVEVARPIQGQAQRKKERVSMPFNIYCNSN